MKRKSDLLLCVAIAVAGLGAAVLPGTGPAALDAQVQCGPFSGSLCVIECTRECTNGSCCSWQFLYRRELTEHQPLPQT